MEKFTKKGFSVYNILYISITSKFNALIRFSWTFRSMFQDISLSKYQFVYSSNDKRAFLKCNRYLHINVPRIPNPLYTQKSSDMDMTDTILFVLRIGQFWSSYLKIGPVSSYLIF